MLDARAALSDVLARTPLAERLDRFVDPFLLRRGADAALRRALSGPTARGLARVLASHSECSRYLAIRPALLERIADATPSELAERQGALESLQRPASGADLEGFLDALRLFRRDETLFCAALDLGGAVPFETASAYLSAVAETCLRWALQEAIARVERAGSSQLSILGLGKISGRELTYHSDLDLVFLHADAGPGAACAVALAQRIISYLSTLTPSGIAYRVDARLRPSGRQGALVSAYRSFEEYQLKRAATWEHLALMRARALAGHERGARVLAAVRSAVRNQPRQIWREVAQMRAQVESERAARSRAAVIAFKTGVGGLMDVEFLAQGGVLERAGSAEAEPLPSVDRLLRCSAPGPGAERVLEHYALLRRIEARTRWVGGRATEHFDPTAESAACIAELAIPGASLEWLLDAAEVARSQIRCAYREVTDAGTIGVLSAAPTGTGRA